MPKEPTLLIEQLATEIRVIATSHGRVPTSMELAQTLCSQFLTRDGAGIRTGMDRAHDQNEPGDGQWKMATRSRPSPPP